MGQPRIPLRHRVRPCVGPRPCSRRCRGRRCPPGLAPLAELPGLPRHKLLRRRPPPAPRRPARPHRVVGQHCEGGRRGRDEGWEEDSPFTASPPTPSLPASRSIAAVAAAEYGPEPGAATLGVRARRGGEGGGPLPLRAAGSLRLGGRCHSRARRARQDVVWGRGAARGEQCHRRPVGLRGPGVCGLHREGVSYALQHRRHGADTARRAGSLHVRRAPPRPVPRATLARASTDSHPTPPLRPSAYWRPTATLRPRGAKTARSSCGTWASGSASAR